MYSVTAGDIKIIIKRERFCEITKIWATRDDENYYCESPLDRISFITEFKDYLDCMPLIAAFENDALIIKFPVPFTKDFEEAELNLLNTKNSTDFEGRGEWTYFDLIFDGKNIKYCIEEAKKIPFANNENLKLLLSSMTHYFGFYQNSADSDAIIKIRDDKKIKAPIGMKEVPKNELFVTKKVSEVFGNMSYMEIYLSKSYLTIQDKHYFYNIDHILDSSDLFEKDTMKDFYDYEFLKKIAPQFGNWIDHGYCNENIHPLSYICEKYDCDTILLARWKIPIESVRCKIFPISSIERIKFENELANRKYSSKRIGNYVYYMYYFFIEMFIKKNESGAALSLRTKC